MFRNRCRHVYVALLADPFASDEDAQVAGLIMKTNMSKTDADLLLKMLHSPGFTVKNLKSKNVKSLHQIIDSLVQQVSRFQNTL